MSGVIPSNLKENDVSISNRFPEAHKRGIHTDRQTDTHTYDDSIRRYAMCCISPKNQPMSFFTKQYFINRKAGKTHTHTHTHI